MTERIKLARVGLAVALLPLFSSLPASATSPWLRPAVLRSRARFAGPDQAFTRRALQRARAYLPMIRSELARHGLPRQLAWLPLLESGFRPTARSRAGAVGLWQLMPATARRFGLRVDRFHDDRLDPTLSTRAAAAYLSFLARRFLSWPLVLAAYNAGEGRVGRAIAHSRRGNLWTVSVEGLLPGETRQYVPATIALSLIAEEWYRTEPGR